MSCCWYRCLRAGGGKAGTPGRAAGVVVEGLQGSKGGFLLGGDAQLPEQAQRLTKRLTRVVVASLGMVQLAEAAQRQAPDDGEAAVQVGFQQWARLPVAAQVHQRGAEVELSGSAVDAVAKLTEDHQRLPERADSLVVAALFDKHRPKLVKQPRLPAAAAEPAMQRQGLLEARPGQVKPAVVVMQKTKAVQHAGAGARAAAALVKEGERVLGLLAASLEGDMAAGAQRQPGQAHRPAGVVGEPLEDRQCGLPAAACLAGAAADGVQGAHR